MRYLVSGQLNYELWKDYHEKVIYHAANNKYFLFGSWDEWVPESRVLKYNETGLQKQKELQKAHA